MKEIDRLALLLERDNIPFEREEVNTVPSIELTRIHYPCDKDFVCSAIQGDYTYGGRENLIEIMGLLTDEERQFDDVRGYLTADEVFRRIKADWDAHSVEP